MKVLTLTRVIENMYGTFSMFFGENIILATLERRWEDNKTDVSCIPIGEYLCKRMISPKFGETFEVCDVPNRTGILFHKGNYMSDSKGCILLANGFGELNRQLAVTDSGAAFSRFIKYFAGENEFKLIIRRA